MAKQRSLTGGMARIYRDGKYVGFAQEIEARITEDLKPVPVLGNAYAAEIAKGEVRVSGRIRMVTLAGERFADRGFEIGKSTAELMTEEDYSMTIYNHTGGRVIATVDGCRFGGLTLTVRAHEISMGDVEFMGIIAREGAAA